jgi:hypothetical protein
MFFSAANFGCEDCDLDDLAPPTWKSSKKLVAWGPACLDSVSGLKARSNPIGPLFDLEGLLSYNKGDITNDRFSSL